MLTWKWDYVELGQPFLFFYHVSTAAKNAGQQWEAGKESKDYKSLWPETWGKGVLNIPVPSFPVETSCSGIPFGSIRYLCLTWIRNA